MSIFGNICVEDRGSSDGVFLIETLKGKKDPKVCFVIFGDDACICSDAVVYVARDRQSVRTWMNVHSGFGKVS